MSTGEHRCGEQAPAPREKTYDPNGKDSTPEQNDPSTGCAPCDLSEIENLSCTAKKFARQAEVMNEITGKLETWKGQYEAARQKYADATAAAGADLAAVREVLDALAEQLRCRLRDDQKSCLEQACQEVFADLDACAGPRGCQSPCDGSEDGSLITSDDLAKLTAEIERRRRNLTESADYFVKLVAEPDDITRQAAELKAEAVKLASDVAAGGDSEKVIRWYARWLILDTAATPERLGSGFASTSAYLECLCDLLRCLVSGWAFLAQLEGRKAELDCQLKAQQDACDRKRTDTLQAVLDAYESCCRSRDPEPGGTYGGKGTAD
jgi:hypothetical protein